MSFLSETKQLEEEDKKEEEKQALKKWLMKKERSVRRLGAEERTLSIRVSQQGLQW